MLDIIGVGDTNVDVMIQVPHIPSHDEKVRGKLFGYFAGGITANFCSAAASFGAKVGAVCKIGQDDYGDLALKDLVMRGVDTSHMVIKPDVETYFCMILLDETGEKALTIVETSGFLPKYEEVNISYLKQAKRVHMTTLDMELTAGVAEALKGSETKLSLDIEPTAGSCSRGLWDRVLCCVDIAFPNEAGLAALTGCGDIAAGAAQLLDRGVGTVVVTCGANGVQVFERDGCFHYPAFRVPVRDTTGAGDCFNAVFLTGVVNGWPLKRCAQYASAAAAIAIGNVGARTNLPTKTQVDEFLKERGECICDW